MVEWLILLHSRRLTIPTAPTNLPSVVLIYLLAAMPLEQHRRFARRSLPTLHTSKRITG
jgi:hypothetical protein